MRSLPEPPWVGTPPPFSTIPGLYTGLLPRRCLAYLVDVTIIAIIGLCLGVVLAIMGLLTLGLLSPVAALILALWPLTYHSLFLAGRGATPGMRLFGVEARSWDGQRLSLLQAVIVTILFYVSVSLTAWLVLLMALFNERGRTLHDILANTLVVRSPG
ncbi:RDD family protein [Pelagibius litoralis]|uniref:RDD family protein n=1 Tax=Pelagibius litoralis TaxID=374515 RepID=A0A967EX02_9PROT|nr:RDD family protein [Pelagibius litoralis]NIA67010.1 RDD family protein [Pelagibius litoralis]